MITIGHYSLTPHFVGKKEKAMNGGHVKRKYEELSVA